MLRCNLTVMVAASSSDFSSCCEIYLYSVFYISDLKTYITNRSVKVQVNQNNIIYIKQILLYFPQSLLWEKSLRNRLSWTKFISDII